MASPKNTTDRIIKFFASVKLALFVLIALAAAAIGGTVVPQNLDPEQYIEGYGPQLYTFLSYLDMFDMYHSLWFSLLLCLLLVNLIVCSLERLPRTLRLARTANPERVSLDFLQNQPFSHGGRIESSVEELLPQMRAAFAKQFARPGLARTSWGALLFAHKGAFSRFGAYVVHSSLLFIVAGTIIGWTWGFEAYLNLHEGQAADKVIGRRPAGLITLPFSLRLDRFVVKFYPGGAPSEYRSEVTIIENGREVRRADVRVNHPLAYRGVTFYQSSYGQDLTGAVALRLTRRADNKSFDLKLEPGRPQPLPEGRGTVTLLELAPNLMKAGTAVKLLIRPAEGQAITAWAFKKRPGFLPPEKGPWTAALTEYKSRYYTGLQVNRDPGVWLIWTGCGLMLTGFIITFFFAHQKIYLGLVPENGGTRIIAAGSSDRNQASFKIKFERLAAQVSGPPPGDDGL